MRKQRKEFPLILRGDADAVQIVDQGADRVDALRHFGGVLPELRGNGRHVAQALSLAVPGVFVHSVVFVGRVPRKAPCKAGIAAAERGKEKLHHFLAFRKMLQHEFFGSRDLPDARQKLPLRNSIGVADAGGLAQRGAVFFLRRAEMPLQCDDGFYAIVIRCLINKSHKISELLIKSQT